MNGKNMIEYKISKLPPVVCERARERFKLGKMDFTGGMVFAYYPYIHTYTGRLDDDIIVHECVHLERQKLITPEIWWEKYFTDDKFRLNEELLAYRAQYAWVKKNWVGRLHFPNLKFYAESLCKFYDIPNMSVTIAMSLIQQK